VKRARFLEPAEAELNDAVVYLDAQRPGVGQRFGDEVERAIEVIGKHPDIGSPLTDRVRRFRLRAFVGRLISAGTGMPAYREIYLEKEEAPPPPTLEELLRPEDEEALMLADFDEEQ
jgi:plasmid stabilization system protein ParE